MPPRLFDVCPGPRVRLNHPGRSFEGCSAAFSAGARGVYLVAGNWSRGVSGHALSDREIARCADLAKSCRRVLHVALNTVPGHKDTGLYIEKCRYYIALGVDGLILNDFGLLFTGGLSTTIFRTETILIPGSGKPGWIPCKRGGMLREAPGPPN